MSHLPLTRQELEDMLALKDNEIKVIRKKRYEELEPQVIIDRVKDAKGGIPHI